MPFDYPSLYGIGLTIVGVLATTLGWKSLRFRRNASHQYDFRELAYYGGKHGTCKNLLRGLASVLTGKHRALLAPSLTVLSGSATTALGLFLLIS